MNKTIISIFFSVICIFFFSVQSAFCADSLNILEGVKLSGEGKDYKLNLAFKDDFNDSAYIQRQNNGSYSIYIPDTKTVNKEIKAKYKTADKSEHPVVFIKSNPFIKQDSKSSYVKISVWSDESFNLSLVSGKASPISFINVIYGILAVVMAGFILHILLFRRRKSNRIKKSNKNCMTFRSSEIKKSERIAVNLAIDNLTPQIIKSDMNYSEENRNDSEDILSSLFFQKNKFQNSDEEFQKEKEQREMFAGEHKIYDKSCKNLKEYRTVTNPSEEKIEPVKEEEPKNPEETNIPAQNTTDTVVPEIKPIMTIKPLKFTGLKDMLTFKTDNSVETPKMQAQIPLKPFKTVNDCGISADIIKDPINNGIVSVAKISSKTGFFLKSNDDDSYTLYCYHCKAVKKLKDFDDLEQINLQTRFYDQNGDNDIYIVRLKNYKAMIEFSETEIKELAVL